MDLSQSSSFRARRLGLLCLATTCLGWGLNWPAMKVLLRELPPLFARGTAGLVAAVVIVAAAALSGQSLRVPRAAVPRLAAAAFVNVFAWMGFTTLAMRWLTVGQGAMLAYTMPLWATLLAWPALGQRPTARSGLALLLCSAGLWTLFGTSSTSLNPGQLTGVALALAAALLFALGTVVLRPIAGVSPLALIAWQLVMGCLPMVLAGVALEAPHPLSISPQVAWLWLYMAAVPMGVCYLTWFAALRRLPPATASVAMLLTPVVGVFAAGIFLGEPLTLREILALLLTLGGVALALRKG